MPFQNMNLFKASASHQIGKDSLLKPNSQKHTIQSRLYLAEDQTVYYVPIYKDRTTHQEMDK